MLISMHYLHYNVLILNRCVCKLVLLVRTTSLDLFATKLRYVSRQQMSP